MDLPRVHELEHGEERSHEPPKVLHGGFARLWCSFCTMASSQMSHTAT